MVICVMRICIEIFIKILVAFSCLKYAYISITSVLKMELSQNREKPLLII